MSHVTGIVLAAGKGLRLKSKIPKPLVKINSLPIIIYSLRTLNEHPRIRDIIVVVNKKNRQTFINKIKKYRIKKVSKIVPGGLRRQDSVLNGLKAIEKSSDLVLIHDSARPFIDKKMISSVIKEARIRGAAILGVALKATIKSVARCPCLPAGRRLPVERKFIVKRTLNRNNLWEIQTPQVFKKELILKAYKKFAKFEVTDDAALVEKLGARVSVVLGSYDNIKITTPEDLIIAEFIAKRWKTA
jgi:2-C-methyl-D-erythritol 4-phosphate cytidylyltransferase